MIRNSVHQNEMRSRISLTRLRVENGRTHLVGVINSPTSASGMEVRVYNERLGVIRDIALTTYCTRWHSRFHRIVTCNNETNKPISLMLGNNGLSGKLSESFGSLRSLENIDLSDNDIKGSIPAEIGAIDNLRMLRLSYNQFSSTVPNQFLQLQKLELAHFQSNRLTGEISLNSQYMVGDSSFISDCGVPTGKK